MKEQKAVRERRVNVKKVVIAYFSGTGSTRKVADCMEEQLTAKGIQVKKLNVAVEAGRDIQSADLLMVLAPVYAFRIVSVMEKWVKGLPKTSGTMAAVIAVSGGGEVSPNTACREKCKALLKRRNYRLVYEDMIVMPSNFGTQAEKRLNLELIQVLPHKVEKIVTSILSGEKKTIRPKALDRILAPLGMGEQVGARFFGRFIHASKSCNQCGGCVRNCPRKNIQMKDGQPVFGFRCVWCMKCIYGCPRKALMPRFLKFCVLNDGYDIRKMSKEAGATKFDKKQPYPDNLAWQGVVDYLKKD